VIRHTTRRTTALAAVLLSLALLAACGKDTKVGSDDLTDFKSEGGAGALGGETTTVPAAETTVAPAVTAAPQTTAKPAPTTTAKPAPTTTAAPTATTVQASIVVKVQGDTQGNAFEPSTTQVYQGSIVRFENTDSAAHQVRARNGEFQSPSIAPGGTWDFKVNLGPGTYEFTDATRPYAVGYLEVVAQ
jgi:plastocyanin